MEILKLYRGRDDKVEDVIVHPVTLGEIEEFGEERFYAAAATFCATPQDYMLELDDMGLRYEDVDEYEFFITSLFQQFKNDEMQLFFPNFYPQRMELGTLKDSGESVRIDVETGLVFAKSTYLELVDLVRKMCGFSYVKKIAGNDFTRQKKLEIERMKRRSKSKKKFISTLFPMVSSLVNCSDFKYNHHEIWDMPLFAFMDSVKRVNAVRTANQMYTGGFFGIKLSDVKTHLDWMRPL